MRIRITTLAGLIAATLALPAVAAEEDGPLKEIAGPVEAEVVKVRDGDTVEVEAFIWPMQTVRVAVRLNGVDAPEHRARCDDEKRAADVATERFKALVGDGHVTLTGISGDKYFGRVLADVTTSGGRNVAKTLLLEGLVAKYSGGKRRDWCDGSSLKDVSEVRDKAGRRG